MHGNLNKQQHLKSETTKHILNAMVEELQHNGYRVTKQRRIILEAISCQIGWHVHPKDIYDYVKNKDNSIGIATIYRTIKMLEEMDLMEKIYMVGKEKHLEEFNSFNIICLRCGEVKKIKNLLNEEIKIYLKNNYDFCESEVFMNVYGICQCCNKNKILNDKK